MGTGIPVPPVIPEGSKAFVLCVPDDPFFYGVVMGLLKTGTFKYFWSGTPEQVEAVTDRMLTMYYDYQEQVGCVICELVADCIENDEAVQEAIANAIRTSTSIQQALQEAYDEYAWGKDMPPNVSGKDVTGANPGCDLDKLYGWIVAGINEMDTNNRDSFEVMEGLSNQWERISLLIAAVPGVGVLPVDEVIAYVNGLWSDDLFEAYAANDTLTYRRTLACDLFCLARANDCKLTIDMMLTYFLERITYTGLQTVFNIATYLIGGTWSGTQINDTFYIAQLLFLKFGNAFFKLIGIKPMEIMFQLGEPSDDWILLCEECPEYGSHRFDFTVDEQGWSAFETYAQYLTGDGWAEDTPGIVWIYTTIPDGGRKITAVRFETTSGNQLLAQVGTPVDFGIGGVFDEPGVPFTDTTTDMTGATGFDVPITQIAARIAVDGFVPVTGIIQAITLYFEGSDPF